MKKLLSATFPASLLLLTFAWSAIARAEQGSLTFWNETKSNVSIQIKTRNNETVSLSSIFAGRKLEIPFENRGKPLFVEVSSHACNRGWNFMIPVGLTRQSAKLTERCDLIR
jgi:hypothetical protein